MTTRTIIALKLLVVGGAITLSLGCGGTTNDTIETRIVTEEEMRQLPALPPMQSQFVPEESQAPKAGKKR